MRPEKLIIQAFGAFAKQTTIDFNDLAKLNNLFLISGKTGAGKSTILDAICFALYGESNGGERKSENLRSQFASFEFPTKVDFIFSIGGKRYEISRSPKQNLLKKKGTGSRDVPAKQELVELDVEEPLILTRASEIKSFIEDKIRLNANEFRHVIAIPQGQFRKFLTGDVKSRKKILDTLFQTFRFKRYEEAFKQRSLDLKNSFQSLDAKIKNKLEVFNMTSVEALISSIESIKLEIKSLTESIKEGTKACSQLEILLKKNEELQSKFDKINYLKQKLQDLEKLKPKFDQVQERLDTFSKVAPLIHIYEDLSKYKTLLKDEKTKLTQILSEIKDVEKEDQNLKSHLAQIEEKKTSIEEVRYQIGKFEELLANSSLLAEKNKQLTESRLQLKNILSAISSKEGVLELLEVQKEKLLSESLASDEEKRIIHNLSSRLKDGEPCLVCGSTNHKKKVVNNSAIEDSTIVNRPSLDKDLHVSEGLNLEVELKRIDTEIKNLNSTIKKLYEDHNNLNIRIIKDTEVINLTLSSYPEGVTTVEGLKDFVSKKKKLVQEFDLDYRKLKENLRKFEVQLKVLTEKQNFSLKKIKDISDNIKLQNARINKQLGDYEVKSLKDFESYIIPEDERGELRTRLDNFTDEYKVVNSEFGILSQELSNKENPDLKKLKLDIQNLKDKTITSNNNLGGLNKRLEDLISLEVEMQSLTKSRTKAEELYNVSSSISEIASGKNRFRMSLQSFVLSFMLEEVLYSASIRLQKITNNRYVLRRGKGVLDARAESGLDIEVFDDYTGASRPSHTLSGGESFLASMALALGLSDVVQSHSGGVHLGTLFIDEGFGSLDPEALDLAFNALIDVKNTGKLIGIISHVPELKNRISTQLEVIPSVNGSTVRICSMV